jgi:hypothetical protein
MTDRAGWILATEYRSSPEDNLRKEKNIGRPIHESRPNSELNGFFPAGYVPLILTKPRRSQSAIGSCVQLCTVRIMVVVSGTQRVGQGRNEFSVYREGKPQSSAGLAS